MLLVTGAAGFIGSHLCDNLLKNNIECIGIDNFDAFYSRSIKEKNLEKALQNPLFTFKELDICSKADVQAIFSSYKITGIIHLAAMAGVRPSLERPEKYLDVNVNGTVNLLEEGRKAGIKRYVLASSSSVYGNNKDVPFSEDDIVDYPISPYAATKKSMELLAHSFHSLYNLQIACLRFFTVYGPRQRPDLAIAKFCKLIENNEEIDMYGDGSTYRDYTYIEDIIDGIMKTQQWLENDNKAKYEIFNLGENNTVKLSYLIELIQKNLNKTARINQKPEQPGDVKRTYANIEKAKNLLGYNPRVPIEDGICRYVEWIHSDDQ